jgi:hypothetical protein
MVMTEEERSTLRKEVDRLMHTFVEQSKILGKELFICPLAPDDFRWLVSNPTSGLVGITGICPGAKAYSDERFCCIIVNSKKALCLQQEGFSFEDIIDNNSALRVVPAKDILSKML